MATGFVVGGLAGYVMRTRWAMLLAPLVFVMVCEVSRIGVTGPTVDRPDLSTTFGVLVIVLGRGFQGVIMVLPMMLAAAVGAAWARRADGSAKPAQGWHRGALWTRRVLTVMMSLALVVVGAVLTRPGFTAPITGADGKPLPDSVAELADVRLGGHEQTVLIRGRNTANPVLLYLAGGPGQSDFGYTRAYMSELENDFVFAVWDQRGTGTSYAELDPVDTLTLDRTVTDTVELASYLRDRFGKQRIYLMGSSWGTTLGVLAVQRAPELFQAWIGTGQMVSQLASDQIIYQQVLDYAASTNDQSLTDRMRGYGPPPYQDMYAYAFLIGYYDRIGPYPKSAYFETQGPDGIDGTGAVEYSPLDKINKEKAIVDMASVMYPQLQTAIAGHRTRRPGLPDRGRP